VRFSTRGVQKLLAEKVEDLFLFFPSIFFNRIFGRFSA
jgi:hypothetical protein